MSLKCQRPQRPQWAAVLHLGDPVWQSVFPDQTPQPGVSGPDQSESLNLRCFTKKIYMLLMMKFWAVQWCWLWNEGTMMLNEINNSLEKQLTKVVFLVFVVISGDVEVNPRIGLFLNCWRHSNRQSSWQRRRGRHWYHDGTEECITKMLVDHLRLFHGAAACAAVEDSSRIAASLNSDWWEWWGWIRG